MTEYEKICRKLDALRRKNVAAGCTAEEADAAMEIADRLMRKHKIREEDLCRDSGEPAYHSMPLAPLSAGFPAAEIIVCDAISRFTDCALLSNGEVSTDSLVGAVMVFVGRKSNLMVAGYVHAICIRFMHDAARAHGFFAADLLSFGLGMAVEISNKLDARTKRATAPAAGSALVPLNDRRQILSAYKGDYEWSPPRATTIERNSFALGSMVAEEFQVSRALEKPNG